MKAEIQWLAQEPKVGVLRVFDFEGERLAERRFPYCWACAILVHPDGAAEFMGVDLPITKDIGRAIRLACNAQGLSVHHRERPIVPA